MADDLIRKSDVLETYADLYDIFDDNKAIQEELHKVFDKINDIPAVEPNSSEKPNNCEDEPQYDFGEYADRLWKIAYERGKREALEQTEPQTERGKLINAVVKLDMSREDKFKVIELLEQHCEKCKHYLFTDIDGYYCEHETYGQPCNYEPKDEPQTERSE